MVVGGPRLDCPTSASTMAIRRSCARRILANHVRKVVFPVSVAPRSKIVRACRRSSNAALPTRLFYQPRHHLHLSIPRADAVPPGSRLPQDPLLLDTPSRRGRPQPPHRYGWVCCGDGPPDTEHTSIKKKWPHCLVAGLIPMPAAHIYGSAYIRLQMPPRFTTNILSMKRRHQSRQRGFTRMYDSGMHGGWARLAQGPGIQGRDFWGRRAVTRHPLPLRHLHNRLLYRQNTYHLHRCSLRKNIAHTRHIQSVHRLRLPPHMNCSTLPFESSPLWP